MNRVLPFLLVGALLAAWETAWRSGLWSPLLFPSLVKIVEQLAFFFTRPQMLAEALVSLERAARGRGGGGPPPAGGARRPAPGGPAAAGPRPSRWRYRPGLVRR
jgi:hypothetical protein